MQPFFAQMWHGRSRDVSVLVEQGLKWFVQGWVEGLALLLFGSLEALARVVWFFLVALLGF